MELTIQIKSLLFSYFYGITFSIIISIFEKFIYHKKVSLQIINALLISILFCLMYFIFIRKLNNGVIHIYFILMVLFGMFCDNRMFELGKRIKKLINKTNKVSFKKDI